MEKDLLRPGVTWVTPTRRLAHHLRVRHDAAAAASGLEVWPTPDVVAWSDLVERLFKTDRTAGRVHGRWLGDGAARLVFERIAEDDRAATQLLSPGQLGRAAFDAWRHLHDYAIPMHAVEADERPEAQAFCRWARAYSDWCRRHAWTDGSTAIERLDPHGAGAALEFVGFETFTPAQQAFIDRLRVAGVEATLRTPTARAARRLRTACRDRRDEVECAVRWAAGTLENGPGLRVAIIVPDLASRREEVRRILERVLTPAGTVAGGAADQSRSFELAAARPLAERAIVAAALDVLSTFARGPQDGSVTRLLLSPFVSGAEQERDSRARMDARLRRDEDADLGLARVAQLVEARCPAFSGALRAALACTDAWPRRALPSLWSREFSRLLAALGWPGEDPDGDEHQARQRWQRLVGEFGSCDEHLGAVRPGEAVSLLGDMARGTLFEPQTLEAPLTVIDAETCAGMEFDALWICGLDATRWPPPAAPDPFLPRDWQVRRGLPGATAELSASAAQRTLERLCGSADDVVLSHALFDDDAPLLPGACLDGIEPAGELPSWPQPSLAVATFATRPALERCSDGSLPPLAEGEASRGGAKLLELQSACPFRAQAELRLGARPLEDPEAGIAAADRGELVHAVLARLWNDLVSQDALHALGEAELRERVRGAIEEETRAARRGASRLRSHLLDIEADWLMARVLEMMDADRARPAFRVESLEAERSFTLGRLDLSLRIDRVDRLADGTLAVIDYKTGADAESGAWLGERPRLPQMPLYSQAVGSQRVAALAFGRLRTGETGYVGLASGPDRIPGLADPSSKRWPKDAGPWEELQAAWERRLATLAGEYARGEARLAHDPSTACRYCHLGALCRIGESGAGARGDADE